MQKLNYFIIMASCFNEKEIATLLPLSFLHFFKQNSVLYLKILRIREYIKEHVNLNNELEMRNTK